MNTNNNTTKKDKRLAKVQEIYEKYDSTAGGRRAALVTLLSEAIDEDLDSCITLQNFIIYLLINGIDTIVDKYEIPTQLLKKKYVKEHLNEYLKHDLSQR